MAAVALPGPRGTLVNVVELPAAGHDRVRERRFGRIVIKNNRWKDDPRPIDERCTCACCAAGYSRAYLRHLYLAGEILALRLLSLHNLHWYGEIVAGARAAMADRRYAAWAREVTSELEAGVV